MLKSVYFLYIANLLMCITNVSNVYTKQDGILEGTLTVAIKKISV